MKITFDHKTLTAIFLKNCVNSASSDYKNLHKRILRE